MSLWTINIFHFMWFEVEVMSRELGFLQSALGATGLYAFAQLVWPLQSLSQTLFSPLVPPLCLCFSAAAAVGHACK